ncbi:MAG TPA: valine--tRNA ligase [Candidatus Paceibacterota bacterium]
MAAQENNCPEKLTKPYSPSETEGRIYSLWEKSGKFAPYGSGEAFTILMPPTNANGSLHAGHGLVMTIEDIMTRYKRMRGFKTLWLPGLDHAGFETQVVYEKKLEKEGRSRFDIPREDLYKEILDFTLENSKNIKSQIRSMGASCDWSREKFTLDPDIVQTVYKTFKKLYDDGLVYRGKRIVSWCPKHQTSFSDLEIKDEERTEKYYYLKYGPFTISTSRPETKFGDKYVVMHPDDQRYKQYEHGQKLKLEWINGEIEATVIKDTAVDQEFGTGVMTITPWHDTADFEIAKRHDLDMEQVIDLRGKLLPIAGEFAGQHISKAREAIVAKLASKGLVEKIDEGYKHTVHTCYKCNTLIEPQVMPQWFVKMRPLAKLALEKIRAKEITYIPDHYEKITTHWLENILDWNISRQIVWGIPIPAKICDSCGEGYVDLENKISTCPKCGGTVHQDTDTFDTWFSSGQWPFAALGYPDGDAKTFYPTDVMETAGEIIFFWVARMIMLSLYTTGKVPFQTVYLHGLVLDGKGQKMSKSKGNVINPLDYTAKYGTDAFRMGLVIGNTPGTSLALSEDKIRAYKNFANKLWNIARFVMENESGDSKPEAQNSKLLAELEALTKDVTSDMDNYRFYLAAEKLYHFTWHEFADKYIEEAKKEKDPEKFCALRFALCDILKLLHPFMPFVTEEIWGLLGYHKDGKLLMIETWPTP